MELVHGTYIGPLAHLKGKGALLRVSSSIHVLAQFDDVGATREPDLLQARPHLIWGASLGYGWHTFRADEFKTSPPCFAVQHSDAMVCRRCDLAWDMNDPSPPSCRVEVRADYTVADLWHDLENPRHGN